MNKHEEIRDVFDRVFNYCEEIDNHLPKEHQTGYKMLPDVIKINNFIYDYEKSLKKETPVKVSIEGMGTRYCSICGMSYLHNTFGNENKYCGYCGVKLDWSK